MELPTKEDDDGVFRVDTEILSDLASPPSNSSPMTLYCDGICEQSIRIRYAAKPVIDTDAHEIKTKWFHYNDSVTVNDNEAGFFMRFVPKDEIVEVSEQDEYNNKLKELRSRSLNQFPALFEDTSKIALVLWAGAALGLFLLIYFSG